MAETTHATTGAPDAGHKAGFPPFQPETYPGQLIWFAIAFGLLYYLMSKIALPKVGAILHDRAQRIAADLDEAGAMRRRAEEAGASYEASLTAARDKAKSIAQGMRDKLGQESDARRKALEEELSGKLASAEQTISTRTRDAMASVRGIAADAATAIVERLTGRAPDPAAIEAALDRASQR